MAGKGSGGADNGRPHGNSKVPPYSVSVNRLMRSALPGVPCDRSTTAQARVHLELDIGIQAYEEMGIQSPQTQAALSGAFSKRTRSKL